MKNKFFIIVALTSIVTRKISGFGIPIGAGVAEVWNNSIYFLGGATRWWGTTMPHL